MEVEGVSYALTELYPTGAIPDSEALVDSMKLLGEPPSAESLPAQVDLTDIVPTPGSQSGASCVGWALGYAAKSSHEAIEEGWSLATPFHQFSPTWIWNQLNGGIDQGIYISSALNLLVNKGADTRSSFDANGDFSRQPDAASFERAAHFKAASWHTLNVDELTLKSVLASGAPVVVGMQVLPDFDALNSTSNTVYDTASGTRPNCSQAPCSRGGHAVTLIGYDNAQGAFRFINSWGTGWGDGGYGWIAYSFIQNSSLGMHAYELVDGPNQGFNDFDVSFGGDTNWVGVALRDNPRGAGYPELTPQDVLIGDFTGDGRDDLFATTGEGWYVSESGDGPWVRSANSTVVAKDMVIGDFNGDRKSDVLYANGSIWRISYSGNSSWSTVANSIYVKADLLVGDFDGNGTDDVFRTTNGTWYISSGAQGTWASAASSTAALENLRVGEFDGLKGDDIFYTDGSRWKYSSAAKGSWVNLASSSARASALLIGNFDGSGTDDVFTAQGGEWRISKDARNSWTKIATSQFGVSVLRVGNFDGGTSDILK